VRIVGRFYKEIAEMAKTSNSKLIIDTSGDPLRKALEARVYLNLMLGGKIGGVEHLEMEEVNEAAKK
jgi:6-phosphofructokinase 2